MKKTLISLSVFLLSSVSAIPALADNTAVETAIQNRADLSDFYQAMVYSGVSHELQPGKAYSIFAPTNDVFAQMTQDKYPCFYAEECRAQVAAIVRNHIIPGEVYVSDIAKQQGGVYSINHRFVTIGELNHDNYTADGRNIIYTSWLAGGGVLYKVDGLIANPAEFAVLAQPVETARTVTVARTIADPACGLKGCADETTQTTTVMHMVDLAPAR